MIAAAGIKISSRGFACCPFHDERHPSFHVKNNHFKCFGCGASGDVVDFIQKLHGLSFKEALHYLGIAPGPITANSRREIRERERKRKIEDERRQRKRDLLYTLAVRIRKIHKMISEIRTAGQMEACADLFHQLPYLEYAWDSLFWGEPENVSAVAKEFKYMPLVTRNRLFNESFDFSGWLRDFIRGRAD